MPSALLCRAAAAACTLFFLPGVAGAATIGFDIVIDGSASSTVGSTNVPRITVTNTGTAQLTQFSLSVGDPTFNFDGIVELTDPAGGTSTILTGDTNISGIDGVFTDEIVFGFAGFDPGEQISFAVDVDADSGVFVQDFRTILFNNAAAPNAVAEARFEGIFGVATLVGEISDQPALDAIARESFTAEAAAPPAVPLPASLPLALAAFAGLGFLRRPARRS